MATPFLSICPNCSAKIKLKNPDLIGRKARCPKCAEPFVVKRARSKSALEPAGATSSSPSSVPKQKSAPGSSDEDWLNGDLSSFDTDDSWPPSNDRAAPPVVNGASKKKRPAASGGKSKPRRRGDQEQSVAVSCLLSALAGCVAAAIGAAIWLTIIIMTGYEIGLLAWAIGGLVGFGTLIGSREHIVGDLSGMIAAVVALLAVTGPKFLLLLLGKLMGMPVGLGDLFTVFDILWVFLAVGTAFRVGSGQGGDE